MAAERTLNVADMRANLSELTSKAYFDGDRFIVKRRGVPMAVLLGIEDYRHLIRAQEEARGRLQQERRRLAEEMDVLRARIGPMPFKVADLIGSAREDNEERYG